MVPLIELIVATMSLILLAVWLKFMFQPPQKKFVRSLESYSLLALEDLAEPVIFMKGHIITSVNRATLDTFGYKSSTELVGKSVTVLMHETEASIHHTFVERYESTGVKKVIGNPRGPRPADPCN